MSEEDQDAKALQAARLYANDKTFGQIGEELKVSKSHAQVLTRRGITLLESEKRNPERPIQETPREIIPRNPGDHPGGGDNLIPFNRTQTPFSQDTRTGNYMLETAGIGRRVLLTPKAIMIFDLWRGSGFTGDLSDFLEDAVSFMYETRRPRER